MEKGFNQSVEHLTGSSRCAQVAFVGLWRLPPVAHAGRSAASGRSGISPCS